MKHKHILFLLASLAMLACGPTRPASTADCALDFDKEQVWQLTALAGRPLPAGNAGPVIILMFHPESGTLRGRVACNRYFADYAATPAGADAEGCRFALEVKYVSGGDVQCPEGGMAEQQRYLSLLEKADACLLTPTALTLFRKGKETLKFELQ